MDISKLKIGSNVLNIKDSIARNTLENVESKLNTEGLEDGDVISWDSKSGKFVNTSVVKDTLASLEQRIAVLESKLQNT